MIGAINGAAVTGGLEIALYCDVLIASDQPGSPTRAQVGLLPTSSSRCGCHEGRHRYGPPDQPDQGLYRAEEALRAGLVTQVVPHAG